MSSPIAYAARIDVNNVVKQVIVIPFMDDDDEKITAYCNEIGLHGRWIDTSYKGSRRKNYAGIGFIFDETRDAFIAPRPYPSWLLDETTCQWNPPVTRPTDGKPYRWDEETTSWVAAFAG